MGAVTVVLAIGGTIALVAAIAAPVHERISRGTVVGMGIVTLVCVGQIALAALQGRPGHAVALGPWLFAGGVVLVRGVRTRGADGFTADG